MTTRPIILTGSLSIDRIMSFSGRYRDLIKPDKLDVLSLSVLIDTLADSPGGTAGNIAYNLGLLGVAPILLGTLGKNDQSYLDRLKALGVVTDFVHLSSLPTATFTVLTDTEDNQVGGFYPGAMTDHDTLTFEPWVEENPLVVISANDPGAMRKYVAYCIEHHLDYVYDVGQQVSNLSPDDLKEGVKGAYVVLANDYEYASIQDKTGLSLDSSVPIVVTTLGKNGCTITGKELASQLQVPARHNIEVVDPTGAGDAFRGGFIYGLLHEEDLEVCARLGNITGSIAVSVSGTQEHIYNLTGIKEIYKTIYKGELC